MVYGYSSLNGNQQEKCKEEEMLRLLKAEKIIFETQGSNKKLNNLLLEIEQGDTIVATSMERFCCNFREFLDIIDILKNKEITLRIGTFIFNFTTDLDPMVRGMLEIMGIFAEMNYKLSNK